MMCQGAGSSQRSDEFRFSRDGLPIGLRAAEAQVHARRRRYGDMFQERLRPLEIAEGRVAAARLSLNAPIVSTLELATGPARAAIVMVHEEGEQRAVVVVRSISRDRVVQYQLVGEDFRNSPELAIDAALSFAESMGFLFDDEVVAGQSEAVRERAFQSLRELLAPPRAGEAVDELELEEAEILLDAEAPELAEAREPEEPGAPGPRPLLATLTKFRGSRAEAEPRLRSAGSAPSLLAETTAPGNITLGRVRPRRQAATESSAIAPLLRLLASF